MGRPVIPGLDERAPQRRAVGRVVEDVVALDGGRGERLDERQREQRSQAAVARGEDLADGWGDHPAPARGGPRPGHGRHVEPPDRRQRRANPGEDGPRVAQRGHVAVELREHARMRHDEGTRPDRHHIAERPGEQLRRPQALRRHARLRLSGPQAEPAVVGERAAILDHVDPRVLHRAGEGVVADAELQPHQARAR